MTQNVTSNCGGNSLSRHGVSKIAAARALQFLGSLQAEQHQAEGLLPLDLVLEETVVG